MEPEQSCDVIDDDVINQQVLDGLASVERYIRQTRSSHEASTLLSLNCKW